MKCCICGREIEEEEAMYIRPLWRSQKIEPCHETECIHKGVAIGKRRMGKKEYEAKRAETLRLLKKALQSAGVRLRDLVYNDNGQEETVTAYFYNDKQETAIVTKEDLAGMVYETLRQIPELQWGD